MGRGILSFFYSSSDPNVESLLRNELLAFTFEQLFLHSHNRESAGLLSENHCAVFEKQGSSTQNYLQIFMYSISDSMHVDMGKSHV